jgi:N utilization substance protein B
MKRREARELAFVLLFERTFREESIDEIVENATEADDLKINEFAYQLASGVADHLLELDEVIRTHSKNWNINRIPRVALSALRLAIYEIKYLAEIPESVSINEAVELSKKFAGEEDSAFVNGLLGAYVKNQSRKNSVKIKRLHCNLA